MTDQNAADLISVPQGGGAISGIGETFQPDLHTGTGNLTIPLQLPAGRNGLQPSLALSYSTGNPNGPFGLGWALPVPGVRRKTNKGIPRYDPQHPDLDTFVLSGAEDLVRVSDGSANPARYRPRSEAGYARITHVTGPAGDYWEVWSTDGLRSRYGTPRQQLPPDTADPAVIFNPAPPHGIFAWLLTETVDPLGNRISYTYQAGQAGTAQRYLSEISYADYGDDPASPHYLVTIKIVLDPNPRPDPFSDHRPGFELRTTQRVAAIETWTNAATPVLARRVDLSYANQTGTLPANAVSLLTRITVTGIDGDNTQALPPLELGYTPWDPAARRYRPLGATAAQLPATSLATPGMDLVDMFSYGLPSILQLNGAARYWRNRGDGTFDPPRSLAYAPAGINVGDPGVQLADLDGDGRPDLLVSTPERTGYWPLGSNGGFDPAGYVPVSPAPTVSLSDPLVRLMDLDGDGVTDALRTGDKFELFYSDNGAAFNRVQVLRRGGQVPDITFGDPRVFLADMTGDGLTDLVLVHDGNITYWPYQGYGSWGAKVVMGNAPHFPGAAAYPGTGFDPRRLLLGDVDGDGCADLVYVGDGTVTVWINQAGIRFADPVLIRGTPRAAGASIRLADMDGTGTAGILWSYDLGSVRGSSYKFLDLTGGTKPYLLSRIDNHAGATTTITYAPSTTYATADRAGGHPWQTTLPFPVQVVARTSVTDYFSQNTLTSEYFYHHGYWDGVDREFRGFARVDQRDTLTPTGPAPDYYSPPTETRNWFHPGPVGSAHAWTDGVGMKSSRWSGSQPLNLTSEYWPGDSPLTAHADISAVERLNPPDSVLRSGIRALRGRVLRSELYALDGDPHADRPYQITDHAYALAPILGGRQLSDWEASPVVTVQPLLDRTSVWERGADPMTKATVTGGYDDYGRPHQSVQIAVPRGRDPHVTSPVGTSPYLATITLTDYATRDDDAHYLINRVSFQQRLELTEDATKPAADLITYVRHQLATPPAPSTDNVRALTLTYYDGPPFEGLPTGQLGDWGLRTRVETLALTPGILAAAYQGGDPSIPLPPYLQPGTPEWTADYPQAFQDLTVPLAGYRYQPDQAPYLAGWYTQQEGVAYDIQQNGTGRGLAVARLDPLGNKTTITYDDPYQLQLLPTTVTDPAGLTRSATYDYRVLRPSRVTDPNGNQTAVGYTPLSLPAWIAATGKPGANQGDTLAQPGTVFDYDLTAWDDNPANPQPMSVHTTRRVDHAWTLINAKAKTLGRPLTPQEIADLFPPDETTLYPDRFIQKSEFSDGFGRLLQTRAQADDTILDDLGLPADMSTAPGPVVTHQQDPAAPLQVVVSGWQTYDNKGRVVEKFEPCFGTDWAYLPCQGGVKVVTVYDPRGLAILTIFPDGSEQRLVPGVPPDLTNPDRYTPTPWETYRYDQDDNAGRTDPTGSAAWASQWNTPASDLLDPLGRIIKHTEWIATGALTTVYAYDIDGNLVQVTDPLGRAASHQVYDLHGRSWRQQLIDAGTARIVLDAAGGTVEHHDSKGALRLAAVDALRRPLRAWARDRAADVPTLRGAVVYGDDQAETGLQPGDASAANVLGRPYHTYDEAGRAESTSYDLDGNLLEKGRRVLSTTVLMSALPGPAGDWANAFYQADWQPASGQTLAQHADPLLDTTAYSISTIYDALARPTSMTAPLDADGTRKTLHPTYSRAGKLTALDVDGDSYLQQILYNARGQRAIAILGCGTMIRYAYDPLTFRLARLRSEPAPATSSGSPAGPVTQDYGYEYDLVGNLLTLHDRTPGSGIAPAPDQLDRAFSYDPLYRLLSATGRECDIPPPTPWLDTPRCVDLTKVRAYTEAYSYDGVGGLVGLAHRAGTGGFTRSYDIAPASNQATAMTTGTTTYQYAYDASGNMLSEATNRLFEWNHTNQAATFRDQTPNAEPTVYTQYRYDASGQRVLKIVRKHGGQLTVTTYIDGLFERITLTNATSTSSHDTLHIFDNATRIATARAGPPLPNDPSPTVAYHLDDHLGSSTAVLDSSGALFNREEYTPYGETSFGSFAKKRYRFTAKERDEESGLYYNGARYYAPWLARWISTDPIPKPSQSPYRYAADNPLRMVDPSGAEDGMPPLANTSAAPSVTGTTGETADNQRARTPLIPPPLLMGRENLLGPPPPAPAQPDPPGSLTPPPLLAAPDVIEPPPVNAASPLKDQMVADWESIRARQNALEAGLAAAESLSPGSRERQEFVRRWINLDLDRAVFTEYATGDGTLAIEHKSQAQLLLRAWQYSYQDRANRSTNTVLRDVDHYFTSRVGEASGGTTVRTSGSPRTYGKDAWGPNWFPLASWFAAGFYDWLKSSGKDMRVDPDQPASPPGGLEWVAQGMRDSSSDAFFNTLDHPAHADKIPLDGAMAGPPIFDWNPNGLLW
jgi:RHS repeat-associated protein